MSDRRGTQSSSIFAFVESQVSVRGSAAAGLCATGTVRPVTRSASVRVLVTGASGYVGRAAAAGSEPASWTWSLQTLWRTRLRCFRPGEGVRTIRRTGSRRSDPQVPQSARRTLHIHALGRPLCCRLSRSVIAPSLGAETHGHGTRQDNPLADLYDRVRRPRGGRRRARRRSRKANGHLHSQHLPKATCGQRLLGTYARAARSPAGDDCPTPERHGGQRHDTAGRQRARRLPTHLVGATLLKRVRESAFREQLLDPRPLTARAGPSGRSRIWPGPPFPTPWLGLRRPGCRRHGRGLSSRGDCREPVQAAS